MKKLVIVALIVAAALFGYRVMFAKSAAFETYQQFAELMAYGQTDEAIALCASGSQADDELKLAAARKKMRRGTGMTYSITGISYSLRSESREGDEVTLDVHQTVRISGGGQESAFGRPVVHRQRVSLKETAAGWRVSEFDDEIVTRD